MRINPVLGTSFNGYLKIIVKGDPKAKIRDSYVDINTDNIQKIEEGKIYTKANIYKSCESGHSNFSSTNPQYNTLLGAYTAACQKDNVTVVYEDSKFSEDRNYESVLQSL